MKTKVGSVELGVNQDREGVLMQKYLSDISAVSGHENVREKWSNLNNGKIGRKYLELLN